MTQSRQILHVEDFCNDCGNCTTFCVHQGQPYADKPRLFLREDDFEREDENAFFIERRGEGWVMRRRENGSESRLLIHEDELIFEDGQVRVCTGRDLSLKWAEIEPGEERPVSLVPMAEMYVVLEGVRASADFILQGLDEEVSQPSDGSDGLGT